MPTRIAVILWTCSLGAALAANDVPVPASCTPAVNQKLAQLLNSHQQQSVDNVMVCGTTYAPSRTQKGGPHGDHQILSINAKLPNGSFRRVEVVTNDALDGKVTASANASVFAYGQAFFSHTKPYSAGVHDVHCATHAGADNGWVVVNGMKHPESCPATH